jgi:hypothetical protein
MESIIFDEYYIQQNRCEDSIRDIELKTSTILRNSNHSPPIFAVKTLHQKPSLFDCKTFPTAIHSQISPIPIIQTSAKFILLLVSLYYPNLNNFIDKLIGE